MSNSTGNALGPEATSSPVPSASPTPTSLVTPTQNIGAQSSAPAPAAGGSNPQAIPGSSISQSTYSSNLASPTGIPSPSASKNGLSGGAVAGIAIGMLLAGTVIAGAISFFLFRRSQQKRRRTLIASHSSPSAHRPGVEKSESKMPSVVTNRITDQIPQPVSDDTITDEVSKIRDSIKNHVRTYCHSGPVNQTVSDAALRGTAQATNLSSSSLAAMLNHPSTRQDALRAIFAWVILSKTASNSDASLLPEELSKLSIVITSGGNHSSHLASYSTWKTITAALMQPRFEKTSQDPAQAVKYGTIIAELDSIIAPFVQGSLDGGQRRKNLTMILTRSANLAFLLFSQPGSFNFEFASSRGGLVVFPALSQTVDDNGQALNPPRMLADGEIVAV